MIQYRAYVEDVGGDQWAIDRGFLHPDNRTTIHYLTWTITAKDCRQGWERLIAVD